MTRAQLPVMRPRPMFGNKLRIDEDRISLPAGIDGGLSDDRFIYLRPETPHKGGSAKPCAPRRVLPLFEVFAPDPISVVLVRAATPHTLANPLSIQQCQQPLSRR